MKALSVSTLLSLALVCKGRQMWRDRASILIGWYLKIPSTHAHIHCTRRWMGVVRHRKSYPNYAKETGLSD